MVIHSSLVTRQMIPLLPVGAFVTIGNSRSAGKMLVRIAFALVLVLAAGRRVHAQTEPPVDSLIAEYLELGASASWQPGEFFDECLPLVGWRERGFNRLVSTQLSVSQAGGLALAWAHPLRTCNNARLQHWYFDELDELTQQNADAMEFWVVLSRADFPPIKDYLQALMLNPNLPDGARSEAGTAYFDRFDADERLRAYSRAFKTMRMPGSVAWGVTQRLLRERPEQLLNEIGEVVRNNPGLGDQMAFMTITENSYLYASDAARSALAVALETGLDRQAGLITGRHRERLESAVAHLKRPTPGRRPPTIHAPEGAELHRARP